MLLRWLNFVREHELLSHGLVTDYCKPINQAYQPRGLVPPRVVVPAEYKVFRDGFTSDDGLSDWKEAVLYTKGDKSPLSMM